MRVLLKRFHLNGNTLGFHPQIQKLELHTKDAFQKSELAGRTMAGPVILKTKKAFSKSFWRKAISFVYTI